MNAMMFVRSAALAVCAMITGVASAGVVPPPWHQGTNPDFTSPQTDQLWTFGQPSPLPDQFSNPNGVPQLSSNAPWTATNPYGPQTGGWMVGGPEHLSFLIPNYNQTTLRKQIWIVIKFSMPPAGAGVPVVDINGLDGSPGTQINTPTILPVGPNLSEIAYLFEMPTCWTFRCDVSVPQGIPGSFTYIDQVYIATRCIPTPGAAACVAIGAMFALRRRR